MGLTSKANEKEHTRLNHKNTIRSQVYYDPISKLDLTDRSYQLATTHFTQSNMNAVRDEIYSRIDALQQRIVDKNTALNEDIEELKQHHLSDNIFFDYNLPTFYKKCLSLDSRLNILESYTQDPFQQLVVNYTNGNLLRWYVPYGVNSIKVELFGSQGMSTTTNQGGKGGYISFKMNVNRTDLFYLYVGCQRTYNDTYKEELQESIYNATDIRLNNAGVIDPISLNSRIGVAGSGGNASFVSSSIDATMIDAFCAGGSKGKGTKENTHYESSNKVGLTESDGGSQTEGGIKPSKVIIKEGEIDDVFVSENGNGSLGIGGSGISFDNSLMNGIIGAGGSGWYGGSSGGALYHKSGNIETGLIMSGAGGSSYTSKELIENKENIVEGDGKIIITRLS